MQVLYASFERQHVTFCSKQIYSTVPYSIRKFVARSAIHMQERIMAKQNHVLWLSIMQGVYTVHKSNLEYRKYYRAII